MIQSALASPLVAEIGWTLLHFLWQGILLAALLELALAMTRSAAARHNMALATLLLMAVAPIVTFLFLHVPTGLPLHDEGGPAAFAVPSAGAVGAPVAAGIAGGHALAPAMAATPQPWLSLSGPWLSWLVLCWFAGMAALSLRALAGWWMVESLRRRDVTTLPNDLLARCHALKERLAVTRAVRFLQSSRVSVPVVIGWFRPVILVPAAAIAGLAPQQLEALIQHELAHIRRHDALINLLQLAVETILFYHPAVWHVSRRIRIERENCCDDLAVSGCGDAVLYVEALTALEAGRLPPGLVLAAHGGHLRDRVARLLGVPARPRRYSLPALAGLLFTVLVAGTVALAQPGTELKQPAITALKEAIQLVQSTPPAVVGENAIQLAQATPPADAVANGPQPAGEKNQNVDITADRVTVNPQGDPTRYQGNVTLTQSDVTVRADSVRIETVPLPIGPLREIKRLVADGDVFYTNRFGTQRSGHLVIDIGDNRPLPEQSRSGIMPLVYVLLPLLPGQLQQSVDDTMRAAERIRAAATSCTRLNEIQYGPGGGLEAVAWDGRNSTFGPKRLMLGAFAALDEQERRGMMPRALSEGEWTVPVVTRDGVKLAMRCDPQAVATVTPPPAPQTQGALATTTQLAQAAPAGPPSIERIAQFADRGDAAAQTILGLRALDANGGDPAEAVKWLSRAAEQGDVFAQYRLGTLHERGQGVAANPGTAARWYRAAANQGNRLAMYSLAVALANRSLGQPNMTEAARWFARAAGLGVGDAQFNLAVLYERGDGVPQSLVDAYKWYSIAGAAGEKSAKERADVLGGQLSETDRTAAQRAAAAFRVQPLVRAANVPPPVPALLPPPPPPPPLQEGALPTTLQLARLLLPLPPGSPKEAIDNTMRIATQLREISDSCATLEKIVANEPLLKGAVFMNMGNYNVADLHPALQRALDQTRPGAIAMPVLLEAGVEIFARCG